MRSFLLVIILLPFSVLAQNKPSQTFTIKGSIKGLTAGTDVGLYADDVNSEPIASAKATANGFELKGSLTEPYIHILTYGDKTQRLAIFLDNSRVTVTGLVEALSKAEVKGSPSHDDFTVFNNEFSPLFERLRTVVQDLNARKPDPDGALRKEYEGLVSTIQTKTDQFVAARPNSYVSPFVAMVATQLNPPTTLTEQRYNRMSPEVQKGYFGTMLAKNIADAKVGGIGSVAAEFVQNDTSGNPISLSSFRGKYVLIDFWASWCRPCRMENPNVVKAYEDFKGKNFTVLGVSLDRSKDAWIKAIADDKLTWTHVSDLKFWSNAVAVQYKVESIPQNFLVDPEGKIIAKNLRGEELHRKLKELLN
jgi:peroxiredoxin